MRQPSLTPAPSDEPVLLDKEVLVRYRLDLGEAAVRQMIDVFRASSAESLAGVVFAAQAKDMPALVRHAHRLASAAQTMGLARLASEARLTEALARSGDAQALAGAAKLQNELDEALNALSGLPDPA